MKVVILLAAIAIIGACAQETDSTTIVPPFSCDGNELVCKFKNVGHHIKHHAINLGNNLKDVGSAILSAALDQGKDLLANGAQAVLSTLLETLTKSGTIGKREISFFDKIRGHVANGVELVKKAKETLKAAFEKAVDKLTSKITDMSGLKKLEEDADKQIDGVVDEFNKEGKKGFIALAGAVAKKLQQIFEEGMAKLKEMFGKKVEERAIIGFGSLSDAWEKAKGHISSLSSSVVEAFKPHIESLKAGISDLADKAKVHAGNIVDSAKDSFNQLKDKLGDHVEALKGHAAKLGDHATNAVNALKEALSAIALQTVGNVKGTVEDAIKTGKDAAGVVKDHVSDVISGN